MKPNEIEAVVFNKNSRDEPSPWLLYRGGHATAKVELATQYPDADIPIDIKKDPGSWFDWKRTSDGVEINRGGWVLAYYDFECHALPAKTTLNGLYQNYYPFGAGVGTVLTYYRYRFMPDGHFEYCQSRKTDNGVSKTYTDIKQSGTYEIKDYAVHLKYDGDTPDEARPFFYDPSMNSQLWVVRDYYQAVDSKLNVCAYVK